jgi:DNA-binding NarL/FixJ family response regulator
VRVALADDSALFRTGLAMMLTAAGIEVVTQAENGKVLLAAVAADPPDAVLLDIRMPPTFTDEGLVVARQLRERHPAVGILVLSTYAQTSYAIRLLGDGMPGLGYLLKDRVDDIAMLRDALRRVINGESVVDTEIVGRLLQRRNRVRELERLSERERDVLRLMAEGRSNAGIGQQLHLTAKTVESHVSAVFLRLGLHAAPNENRRVLAVLAWLRAAPPAGP